MVITQISYTRGVWGGCKLSAICPDITIMLHCSLSGLSKVEHSSKCEVNTSAYKEVSECMSKSGDKHKTQSTPKQITLQLWKYILMTSSLKRKWSKDTNTYFGGCEMCSELTLYVDHLCLLEMPSVIIAKFIEH